MQPEAVAIKPVITAPVKEVNDEKMNGEVSEEPIRAEMMAPAEHETAKEQPERAAISVTQETPKSPAETDTIKSVTSRTPTMQSKAEETKEEMKVPAKASLKKIDQ